jgi:hypothetical protein
VRGKTISHRTMMHQNGWLTPYNPFTAPRCKDPGDGRFMRHRGQPYEGYFDRLAGCCFMKHNRHTAEGKP